MANGPAVRVLLLGRSDASPMVTTSLPGEARRLPCWSFEICGLGIVGWKAWEMDVTAPRASVPPAVKNGGYMTYQKRYQVP